MMQPTKIHANSHTVLQVNHDCRTCPVEKHWGLLLTLGLGTSSFPVSYKNLSTEQLQTSRTIQSDIHIRKSRWEKMLSRKRAKLTLNCAKCGQTPTIFSYVVIFTDMLRAEQLPPNLNNVDFISFAIYFYLSLSFSLSLCVWAVNKPKHPVKPERYRINTLEHWHCRLLAQTHEHSPSASFRTDTSATQA